MRNTLDRAQFAEGCMERHPNTVEPKRSEGVPKETPERNSLEPLAGSLSHAFPRASWSTLAAVS